MIKFRLNGISKNKPGKRLYMQKAIIAVKAVIPSRRFDMSVNSFHFFAFNKRPDHGTYPVPARQAIIRGKNKQNFTGGFFKSQLMTVFGPHSGIIQ